MKKFLLVLIASASLLMVSCHWIHETFTSVESCTEWYLDELYEAAADNDVSDFRERADQCNKWQRDLSTKDLQRVQDAAFKYGANNPNKVYTIFAFAEEHGIVIN